MVPLGDVEIHSELNETPQPGYHGTKTTLLDREPSVRVDQRARVGARSERDAQIRRSRVRRDPLRRRFRARSSI